MRDKRRDAPLVPLLATGWSHAHGGKPLNLVPCRWRMTVRSCVSIGRFAARVSGLACGLALTVRPAGPVKVPGSTARRWRVPRSGVRSTVGLEGPARTMRGVPALVTQYRSRAGFIWVVCLLSWSGWPDLNWRPLRPELRKRSNKRLDDECRCCSAHCARLR